MQTAKSIKLDIHKNLGQFPNYKRHTTHSFNIISQFEFHTYRSNKTIGQEINTLASNLSKLKIKQEKMQLWRKRFLSIAGHCAHYNVIYKW